MNVDVEPGLVDIGEFESGAVSEALEAQMLCARQIVEADRVEIALVEIKPRLKADGNVEYKPLTSCREATASTEILVMMCWWKVEGTIYVQVFIKTLGPAL